MNTNETTDTTRSMESVDHTNPHTDRPFGERVVYHRGPAVAADGGRRDAGSERDDGDLEEASGETTTADDSAEDAGKQRMEDVPHTPPGDEEGAANRVFERGSEGRDGER
jgi:hypothetical protein